MVDTLFNTTTQHGPDTTDPRTINWAERQARAVVPFRVVDGLPVNPVESHLPPERNGLWHWGPATAADAVVLAFDTEGRRRILLVDREDGYGWALPGGMLDPGEGPLSAARRELAEETGLELALSAFDDKPKGRYAKDPRAGANAWMETFPCVAELRGRGLPAVRGRDDAREAAWLPAASYAQLKEAVAARRGRVFAAHVDILADILH